MPSVTQNREQKFMTDDPLWFLTKPFKMGLSKEIHVKCLQWFIMLYLETCNAIIILELYSGSSNVQFQRFLSVVLIQQVGICSFWIMQKYYKTTCSYPQLVQTHCWNWDSPRKDVLDRIINEYNNIRTLPKIYLIMWTPSCAIFWAQYEYHYNVLDIARNKAGNAGIIFCVLYYLTVVSLGYAGSCVLFHVIYISAHIKFQLLVLSDRVATVMLVQEDHRCEEFNQDLIYQKLKIYVEHHVRIKEFSKSLCMIQWLLVIFALGGAAHYAGMIWFVLLEQHFSLALSASIGIIFSLIHGFAYYHYGQNTKDESTNLFDTLCACQWNKWNKKNRMALQMMMINSAEPISISSFGLVELDFRLATRVSRIVYTLVTFIINFK